MVDSLQTSSMHIHVEVEKGREKMQVVFCPLKKNLIVLKAQNSAFLGMNFTQCLKPL